MLLPLIHIVVPVRELTEEATVGEKIAFYRFRSNLTQEQLANILKIDTDSIIRYEKDKIPLPFYLANKIAKLFNILPEFFYDDYNSFIAYPVSKKIKEYRDEHCLSQKEMATILKVSKRTLVRWENEQAAPTRKNFQKIKSLHIF